VRRTDHRDGHSWKRLRRGHALDDDDDDENDVAYLRSLLGNQGGKTAIHQWIWIKQIDDFSPVE